MQQKKVSYKVGQTECVGHLVYDPTVASKRPAVLVAHAWMGQDEFARQKARDLCELGYVGFAADIYGNGVCVDTTEKAESLMQPLFLERSVLRNRVVAAYEALVKCEQVDSERIGAIGFCFGGLTAIELLRSGVKLRGVVSFHGVLGNRRGELKANVLPIAKDVSGALLLLHGYEDPLVSQEDIDDMAREMTEAQVDWQMHMYGHAVHAFTNPAVHDFKGGLAFNEKASRRSWQSMKNFFEEKFA